MIDAEMTNATSLHDVVFLTFHLITDSKTSPVEQRSLSDRRNVTLILADSGGKKTDPSRNTSFFFQTNTRCRNPRSVTWAIHKISSIFIRVSTMLREEKVQEFY